MPRSDDTAAVLSQLAEFRDEVPADVREQMKMRIISAQIDGYDEMITLMQYIVGEVVAGNLSPSIADSVRKYIELMLTTVTMARMRDAGGTASASVTGVYAELVEANKKGRKMVADYGIGHAAVDLVKKNGQYVAKE